MSLHGLGNFNGIHQARQMSVHGTSQKGSDAAAHATARGETSTLDLAACMKLAVQQPSALTTHVWSPHLVISKAGFMPCRM